MTGDDDRDGRLDALIRAAADRPVDEAALTRRVLAQVRARARPRPAFGIGVAPAGAMAAFAALLVATPFIVAGMPLGRYDPVADVALGVALGGGLDVLLSGIGPGGRG